MTEPFSYKRIDRWIICVTLLPIVIHSLVGELGLIELLINWVVAGLFSWLIWAIIAQQHLGLVDRNHSLAISWVVLLSVMNFSQLQLGGDEQIANLFLTGGFLCLLVFTILSWQQKILPFLYILSGVMVGVLSIFFPKAAFLLVLFPFVFYFMRTWSYQNLGSLATGFLLSVWIGYIVRFFCLGEADADGYILSFCDIFQNFFKNSLSLSIEEWIFLASLSIYIIIYSVLGFTLSVAKTVKSESFIIMISSLSLLFLVLLFCDIQNLQSYIGILAIILSFQLSLHQSYIDNPKFDWCTFATLFFFIGLDLIPTIYSIWISTDFPLFQNLLAY